MNRQKKTRGFVGSIVIITLFAFLFCFLNSTALAMRKKPFNKASFVQAVLQNTKGEKLISLSQQFHSRYLSQFSKAKAKAQKNNWSLQGTDKKGRFFQLKKLNEKGRPIYFITSNLNAAKTVSTGKIWPGGVGGFNLTGNNMLIGEWDGGAVLTSHQEFGNRVNLVDNVKTHYHATHVAGTIIGSGVNSAAKGMAFEASLDSYDWNSDESEMASAAANGLTISNHSYGYLTGWYDDGSDWYWYGDTSISETEDYHFGYYSSTDQDYDTIAVDAPSYLIIKAAGNDRNDAHSVGSFKVISEGQWVNATFENPPQDGGLTGYDSISFGSLGKNILTVGAVLDIPAGYTDSNDVQMTTFSGWGPADDGRIKPDIVANGYGLYSTYDTSDTAYATMSGTSMATPSVTGSLSLLQQHYFTTHNDTPIRSATLKALVIHTADEAGASPGPDYENGWGLLNSAKAAQVISDDGTNNLIREQTLTQENSEYSLEIEVDGSSPFTATICWTDEAGTPISNPVLDQSDSMLVNDLDLRIFNNEGTPLEYFPWVLDPANPANPAGTGDNFRDNVEKVYIPTPPPGAYTIRVTHKNSLANGQQDFSIIVSGISSLQAFPPYSNNFENGLDSHWTTRSSNGFGRIETSTDFVPYSDTSHLIMDESSDTFNINEAWLHLNLASETNTWLSFWWKEFSDEYHDQDGIFFSDNGGIDFTKVLALNGSNDWEKITLNIDQIAADHGLTLSADFVISFQQAGSGAIPSDGFAFDDVDVSKQQPLPPEVIYSDDIESGPGNWQLTPDGSAPWTITEYPSGNNTWFSADESTIKDDYLVTPEIDLSSATEAQLTFMHTYSLENIYDGGVIEISTDGGSSYSDLGPHITTGGYDGVISNGYSSPIADRSAWTGGTIGALSKVVVDLDSYVGQNVRIRFRLACDSSIAGIGWYIDDLNILVNLPSYYINAVAGANGSIHPLGTVTVAEGENHLFTITPDPGFQIQKVTVDGAEAGAETEYTFSLVEANHNISAYFIPQDSDGDGMSDIFETMYGFNNSLNDALLDFDSDGFCNLREFLSNSDPTVPDTPAPIADIDGDNDVDAVDLELFENQYGRNDCSVVPICFSDFDGSGSVDQVDLKLFGEDYGRVQ